MPKGGWGSSNPVPKRRVRGESTHPRSLATILHLERKLNNDELQPNELKWTGALLGATLTSVDVNGRTIYKFQTLSQQRKQAALALEDALNTGRIDKDDKERINQVLTDGDLLGWYLITDPETQLARVLNGHEYRALSGESFFEKSSSSSSSGAKRPAK